MKVIAVEPGAGQPQVVERPIPEPGSGEALIRTLRVGVDGTDHEVIAGAHGGVPEGQDRIILGHEAVGVVEDPNGTDLEEGTLVVPTVRRPPNGPNRYFKAGEPDMAPDGEYYECGIVGADGFMAEYFTASPEYLVTLPQELAPLGILVEPLSVSEKAIQHAFASRSAFDWRPESALVLGNGSLGLLTLAMFQEVLGYDRTYCLGRRDRPDPTLDIIDGLGATYIDSRKTPMDEIPTEYEGMDIIYEATGYAKHAFETIEALAPNGVGALLGVPDDWEFELNGGQLHREFVLHNKALVGSVNSNRDHFASAVDTLSQLPTWFTDDLITNVSTIDDLEAAFDTDDTTIKTAVEFSRI